MPGHERCRGVAAHVRDVRPHRVSWGMSAEGAEEKMSDIKREDITKFGFSSTLADLMLKQIEGIRDIGKPGWERRHREYDGVEAAIWAMLRAQRPKRVKGSRWVVRVCTNWRSVPFTFKTFGVAYTKEAGEFLRAFCGCYINTEVHLLEIEKGVDAFADHLRDFERMHSYARPPLPMPPRRMAPHTPVRG